METKKQFFLECYQLGIIKFGKFTLKSGIESPFYVDLRPLASDPKILKHLANYLLEMLPLDNFDLICGRDAGCKTCGVRYTEMDIKRLEDTNPDYFINSPKEILDLV